VLLIADLLVGWSPRNEEMGGGSGEFGRRAGGRRFFLAHMTSALA
jgi:hypothetical protein